MSSDLADRVRAEIGEDPNVAEIRMFGGLCFMLNGNMLVGTMKGDTLLVRVGEEGAEAALRIPGASRMDMAGRTMKGFVVVSPDHLDDVALREWLARATRFVAAMPPKPAKTSRESRKRRAGDKSAN